MRRLPLLALILPLAACAPQAEPEVLVMKQLSFARETDEGVADGFDLDGRVSDEDDPETCGIADFTSPDGEPGIDNSFAPIPEALEAVGGDALELLIQASIDSGELLLMLAMDNEGVEDGECFAMDIVRGDGAPALGTDDTILPGQTYELNEDAPSAAMECGTRTGDTVLASPFTLSLPLNIFDEFIDITMIDGVMEMTEGEDGVWTGMFAGGVSVQEINDNVATLDGIPDELPALVETVLDVRADMFPEFGDCTQISTTFEFQAVSAFFFDEE